jgi:two-component system, NtrC family, sensor histidine kinase HydH
MNPAEVLAQVIELANSSVDVDRRLMNVVDTVALAFSAPVCALFLWDPLQSSLTLKYCRPQSPDFPPGWKFSGQEGPLGSCILQKVPVIIPDAAQLSLWDPRIPGHFSGFNFMAFFPIADDIFLYGVLALLGEEPRELGTDEGFLLPVICRQLAGTIRGAQVGLQAKKRIAELSTLHAIGTAISSTLELGELLNRITLSSAKILQADGSILRLLDEEGRVLKAVSSFGLDAETQALSEVPFGEDLSGRVALTGESLLIRNAPASAYPFQKFRRTVASAVCVPLIFKSRTIGTLDLFSFRQEGRQEKIFDEEDKSLLSTLANQIAIAIENAIILKRAELLAQEKERVALELSFLYEVSRKMLTTVKLDQILRIVLICVTVGKRGGFDRAALFLVDEKERVLKGMLGVGPASREEEVVWRQMLEEERLFSKDWSIPGEVEATKYNARIQQVRIPLKDEHSLLIRTLRDKRVFQVGNGAADPAVDPEIVRWFGTRVFALLPLLAKERAIGLIAVDNLLTQRPITPGDLGFLTLLANQAALAMENSRLYSNLQEINTQLLQTQNRLIQSEKLAALGEVVASIAHEIKNPLVSIGGFARRLDRNASENTPEKKYLRIVLKEVKRLENILNETLAYCKDSTVVSGPHQLNRLIEETLAVLDGEFQDRNIVVRRELAGNLPLIYGDPQQIKQVFLNLFVNALQAMGQNGTMSIDTSFLSRGERNFIQAAIGDTGGGIQMDILDNIFNPFFTTKQDGTGLGLAITHKIVTQHRGELEVINHPGVGATFLVRFPCANDSAARL